MKRYAIEEVFYDNCVIKYKIPHKKVKCMPFQCEKCGMYGDTKEQFTRKIETAIEIAINRYEEGKIKGRNKNRQCAEIIVEFLGVE